MESMGIDLTLGGAEIFPEE